MQLQMTRLLLLYAVLLTPTWGFSQTTLQPYRQTVVVTAAATPVELGSVTRSLTVITREQLEMLPVHTVADALRLLSSVDVRARGERGVQSDFAVRGANFGQMLVLVDGVRLNDAQSGHHNGDIPVPLDAVERIEVLYGPGSSLFGADAFGGSAIPASRKAESPPVTRPRRPSTDSRAIPGSSSSRRCRALAGSRRIRPSRRRRARTPQQQRQSRAAPRRRAAP